MDQPVAISFLGGFLIVIAAGITAGLLARLWRATTTLGMLVDIGIGTLGGVVMIFVLPMHGVTLGHLVGWPAALGLGVALPIVARHWIRARMSRGRGRFRHR